MKAYQPRVSPWAAIVGLGLVLWSGVTIPASAGPGDAAATRTRVRTLIFRPNDLPGFKLIQSDTLDTSGFTHIIIEGEKRDGYGWKQKWKRAGSRIHSHPAFLTASVLLCSSATEADSAVRQKMSTIAAVIEWRDRLRTSPPAAVDRLFVSPPDQTQEGLYQVFGTAGKLAFHLELHPAQGDLASGDPALVDGLVRQLTERYIRMK